MVNSTVTISLEEYLKLRDFQREIFRAFSLRKGYSFDRPIEELSYKDFAYLRVDLGNDAIQEVMDMLIEKEKWFSKYQLSEQAEERELIDVVAIGVRDPEWMNSCPDASELELEI